MIVGTQTFMYKKEVLNNIGGFENVPAGQEYYLMYKTLKNNYKVGYLDEPLTKINIHSGERITTNSKKRNAEKFLYDLKMENRNILNFWEKNYVKYRYKYNILYSYYNAKSYFMSFCILVLIIICHPIIVINKIIFRRKK